MGRRVTLRDVEPRLAALGYYVQRSNSYTFLEDYERGRNYQWLIGKLPHHRPDRGFRRLMDLLIWIDEREIDQDYRRQEG